MDNFHIDITAEGEETLLLAFNIILNHSSGGKITHYRESKEKGLIFYWTAVEGATKIPFTLKSNGATTFAASWLAEQEYPEQFDFDGSCHKGYRIYCEDWGHVDGQWQAVCAIKPEWTMYGK